MKHIIRVGGFPLSFTSRNWYIWIHRKPVGKLPVGKKNIGRLKLCAVTAVAMSLGSTLMLLMVRAGIGVGKDMIP